jgi:hypothetical protein
MLADQNFIRVSPINKPLLSSTVAGEQASYLHLIFP